MATGVCTCSYAGRVGAATANACNGFGGTKATSTTKATLKAESYTATGPGMSRPQDAAHLSPIPFEGSPGVSYTKRTDRDRECHAQRSLPTYPAVRLRPLPLSRIQALERTEARLTSAGQTAPPDLDGRAREHSAWLPGSTSEQAGERAGEQAGSNERKSGPSTPAGGARPLPLGPAYPRLLG
jgi:hypothetical protein